MQDSDPLIVVNGVTYTGEQVAKIIRFCHEIQYDTIESILQKRGLTAVEHIRHYDCVKEIDNGCRLITEKSLIVQAMIFGLEFSWWRWVDCDRQEFHQKLRERMQKLGDHIVKVWEETVGARG